MFEGAASEQAVHAEDRGSGRSMSFEEFGQNGAIQAWNADNGLQAANRQYHQGEENPRFEFGDFETIAESIRNGSEHSGLNSGIPNPRPKGGLNV